MSKLAFIGGSGLYDIDGVEVLDEISVETPFGLPSDKISHLSFKGKTFYFLARHGKDHTISPSEINYRANIFALKKLGVTELISISAVGSLNERLAPKTMVLPNQFIDWTKGLRKRSFFSDGMVGHVSCAQPINSEVQERLADIMKSLKIDFISGATYICIEGPQFSTQAESQLYQKLGADIIGMTNVPEVFLAKEAGISYATIAMVTDFDGWKDEHCSLDEIMDVMKSNKVAAQQVLKRYVEDFCEARAKRNQENENSVVTKSDVLTKEHKSIIDVLLS